MNEFQRYLVDEFAEDYQEGRISRRRALRLITGVTGSLVIASSILAACAPADQPMATTTAEPVVDSTLPAAQDPTVTATTAPTETSPPPAVTDTVEPVATTEASNVESQPPYGTVSPDDASILAGEIEFPADDNTPLMGYLARPVGDGANPVILVCHENRGLTAHIQDVTRRLAKAGYVGLAVDLLTRQGGTAALSADDVPGALGNTDPDQFVSDFLAGWRYLGQQTYAQAERVGMVGFCFGGGVTWRMATHMPELLAAVPFYGPHPPVADVPNIQAAVLGVYAERDQRINQGIPQIEEAMLANNKVYEKVIYPDSDHAFHNDTGTRYNPEAAQDAWARTLDWFSQYVNG